MWKSVAPMAVALFEHLYLGDRFSRGVYLSMAFIAFSALLTAVNDLKYSLVAYAWALGKVVANVAYLASLVFNSIRPRSRRLTRLFIPILLSLILMVAFASVAESSHVVRDFATTSALFRCVFSFSGLLTTAVCTSAFWTLSVTKGSMLSFVGGLNKVPMILIALLMFEIQMNVSGWAGVGLGVIVGLVFIQAKAISDKVYSPQQSLALNGHASKCQIDELKSETRNVLEQANSVLDVDAVDQGLVQ